MQSFEKDFTQLLKFLFCRLTTKLCLTKFWNLGLRYSINSFEEVFLQTKVNFFKVFPFLDLVFLPRHNTSIVLIDCLNHSTHFHKIAASAFHNQCILHTSIPFCTTHRTCLLDKQLTPTSLWYSYTRHYMVHIPPSHDMHKLSMT